MKINWLKMNISNPWDSPKRQVKPLRPLKLRPCKTPVDYLCRGLSFYGMVIPQLGLSESFLKQFPCTASEAPKSVPSEREGHWVRLPRKPSQDSSRDGIPLDELDLVSKPTPNPVPDHDPDAVSGTHERLNGDYGTPTGTTAWRGCPERQNWTSETHLLMPQRQPSASTDSRQPTRFIPMRALDFSAPPAEMLSPA